MFVPWEPRVDRTEVAEAIAGAPNWRAVLEALGYAYHGKNIATVRKWAARWGISTDHLPDNRGRPIGRIRYSGEQLKAAIAASSSWAEALRRLGYCPTGGNASTLKKRVAAAGLSTEHFDPYAAVRQRNGRGRRPLEEILVEGSTYNRSCLKRRLYEEGLKQRECELCGQGEVWNGRQISLIIDHINGVHDDNRFENLRIICPNCAAGLDTHCGRKNRLEVEPRACSYCGKMFRPKYASHRYRSVVCGRRHRPKPGLPCSDRRRVERPPHAQIVREVNKLGYVAVGRRYGVSDNAIRKWIRQYERELAVAEDLDEAA